MTRITDEAVEAAQKAWSKAYWTTSSPGRKDWMRAALEAALPHLEGATPTRYRLAWLSARRRARYASKAFFAEAAAARELEGATPAIDRDQIIAVLDSWGVVSRDTKVDLAAYHGNIADSILSLGGATPVADNGLRGALERICDDYIAIDIEMLRETLAAHPEGATPSRYRLAWLSARRRATLAAFGYSGEGATPAIDREALIQEFLRVFEAGGLWDGLEPDAYKIRWRTKWATEFADMVLALIGRAP